MGQTMNGDPWVTVGEVLAGILFTLWVLAMIVKAVQAITKPPRRPLPPEVARYLNQAAARRAARKPQPQQGREG